MTISQIREMPNREFAGWVRYFYWKDRQEKKAAKRKNKTKRK